MDRIFQESIGCLQVSLVSFFVCRLEVGDDDEGEGIAVGESREAVDFTEILRFFYRYLICKLEKNMLSV